MRRSNGTKAVDQLFKLALGFRMKRGLQESSALEVVEHLEDMAFMFRDMPVEAQQGAAILLSILADPYYSDERKGIVINALQDVLNIPKEERRV